MPAIASWIREKDQDWFQSFLAPHPALKIANARVEAIDLIEADALLLTGGPDISAEFLGQPVPDPTVIHEPDPERDRWEFAAARNAIESGKPIFAVCKGFQVLNVALGGSLLLDIPNHALPEQRLSNIQPLRYAASTGHRIPLVNSSHHQALDRVAPELGIEAWCAEDDIIEQARHRSHPFCLGVQFHPERDPIYKPLFEQFFHAILNSAPS